MPTQVWYWKTDFSRDLLMGYDWCLERRRLPDVKNLARTHVHLKDLNKKDPEKIWMEMQGEVWSPMGEQNDFIRSKGLDHTSMSIGDVLVMEDGRVLMADSVGFKEIKQYVYIISGRRVIKYEPVWRYSWTVNGGDSVFGFHGTTKEWEARCLLERKELEERGQDIYDIKIIEKLMMPPNE